MSSFRVFLAALMIISYVAAYASGDCCDRDGLHRCCNKSPCNIFCCGCECKTGKKKNSVVAVMEKEMIFLSYDGAVIRRTKAYENECVYPGTCSSLNTLSRGKKCKCQEGYALDPHDSRRCELVTNENATLIFGNQGRGGGIEQFSLRQRTVTRIQNNVSMGNALDVMYRTNTMFWSDGHRNIYTAPIRQGAAKTVVLNVLESSILSVAVDWVYDHLYFADYKRQTMNVANLDGRMRKVLFTTRVTQVWDIALDPLSGWMYWADSHAKKIERAAMDGSEQEVIANIEPMGPTGLTMDMTDNRLYWAVHKLPASASIHSINVDGSDQKIVFTAPEPFSFFHPITTFGDFVYYREAFTNAIYKTNKCSGGKAKAIHSTAEYDNKWLTLQVYHFSKQPEGVNYCEKRIGGQCSHLCFRIPSTGNQSVPTKCACPEGLTLSSDQRTGA